MSDEKTTAIKMLELAWETRNVDLLASALRLIRSDAYCEGHEAALAALRKAFGIRDAA